MITVEQTVLVLLAAGRPVVSTPIADVVRH